MYVVGTAGHVDHGKSALVKALTGIDPDRLPVEKERGMTTDLGFAWLKLPRGQEVSIVDVPGHERFIKNMVAGVGGLNLAMLIIAADESVMPQTREHLAILDLLQVSKGILVITKKELVDQELLQLVMAEAEDLLKGTTLEGSPILATSAHTGEGLDKLKQTLELMLAHIPPRKDLGRPRLPIDRSFTIPGFGTVVTGTLTDGTLSISQEVVLVPSLQRSRIRGLQTHKKHLEKALPGTRVAVNLSGISHENALRGEVLTTQGWLEASQALDVELRLIQGAPHPIKHNASVTFHIGTSESPARVRLLDRDDMGPGETAFAQLYLEKPLAAVKGDLFIVRSTTATLGGGRVLQTDAKRHRRFQTSITERLSAMATGSIKEMLLKELEASSPVEFQTLARRLNLPRDEAQGELVSLSHSGLLIILGDQAPANDSILFSASRWQGLQEETEKSLATFHKQFALRRGLPKEELRHTLKLPPNIFSKVIAQLTHLRKLTEEGPLVNSPSHKVALTQEQQKAAAAYIQLLEKDPFSPPSDAPIDPELLTYLVEGSMVVKVSENVLFSASAFERMRDKIVQHIKEHEKITVAEVRDMLKTSRKYALALMEYMDQKHITRRIGDERVLR